MRKLAIGKKAKEKLTCSNCNKKLVEGKRITIKGMKGEVDYLGVNVKVRVGKVWKQGKRKQTQPGGT